MTFLFLFFSKVVPLVGCLVLLQEHWIGDGHSEYLG